MFLAPFHIFLRRHHDGRGEPGLANACTDDVAVDGVVVGHLILHAVGRLEVDGTRLEVVVGDGGGALYLPSRVEQRVGDGVFVQNDIGQGRLGAFACGRLLVVLRACRSTVGGLCPVALPVGVDLEDRHGGIADHRYGQQQQCYRISLPDVHKLFDAFQGFLHHHLHGQVGLFGENGDDDLGRWGRGEAEHGEGRHGLVFHGVVDSRSALAGRGDM